MTISVNKIFEIKTQDVRDTGGYIKCHIKFKVPLKSPPLDIKLLQLQKIKLETPHLYSVSRQVLHSALTLRNHI